MFAVEMSQFEDAIELKSVIIIVTVTTDGILMRIYTFTDMCMETNTQRKRSVKLPKWNILFTERMLLPNRIERFVFVEIHNCDEKSPNFGFRSVGRAHRNKKKTAHTPTLASIHKTENIILNTISENSVGGFFIFYFISLSILWIPHSGFFLCAFATLTLGQFLCCEFQSEIRFESRFGFYVELKACHFKKKNTSIEHGICVKAEIQAFHKSNCWSVCF